MACNNSPIIKYTVLIRVGRAPIPFPIANVTNVKGLSYGDRETIDVETLRGKRKIVTDRVDFQSLTIEHRHSTDPNAVAAKLLIDGLWKKGVDEVAEILVTICVGGGSIHTYLYEACQLKSYSENDKALGQANLSLITTVWEPFDVSPVAQFL